MLMMMMGMVMAVAMIVVVVVIMRMCHNDPFCFAFQFTIDYSQLTIGNYELLIVNCEW